MPRALGVVRAPPTCAGIPSVPSIEDIASKLLVGAACLSDVCGALGCRTSECRQDDTLEITVVSIQADSVSSEPLCDPEQILTTASPDAKR